MQTRHANRPSWIDRARTGLVALVAAFLLTACGSLPQADAAARYGAATPQPKPAELLAPAPDAPITVAALGRQARIVEPDEGGALQCVTYARAASGIDLYGNAGKWWNAANGRYERNRRPAPGAVLVFRPTRSSVGHVAVISRVVGQRLVVASHANWLNNGQIHEDTPIEDVSPAGDWSQVRVWYTPGNSWGRNRYATFGFIHPQRPVQLAQRRVL